MVDNNKLKEKLKQVSIRGRVAYGLKCIQNYMEENNVSSFINEIGLVENKISEFLTLEKFNEWDEQIKDYAPSSILDEHPSNDFSEYEFLNVDKLNKLKNAYTDLPSDLVNIIENTIEIGRANLYGGIVEYSSATLEPLISIIEIMIKNRISLPRIEIFEEYSFTEDKGWGKKIII